MTVDDISHRGGHQEILLAQAQQLALHMAVVGIKNLADYLGHGILAQGGQVVPRLKESISMPAETALHSLRLLTPSL